jgi:hypothetical protein
VWPGDLTTRYFWCDSFLEQYGEWGYMTVWDSAAPMAAPVVQQEYKPPKEDPEMVRKRNEAYMQVRGRAATQARVWVGLGIGYAS